MDFIEWIARTAQNIQRNGLNLQTIVVTIITLYNVRVIKKLVSKRIPKRFREEDKLDRIESKLDRLAEFLGVSEWGAQLKVTSTLPNNTSLKKKSLLSWLAVLSPVRTIGAFTTLTDRFNHSKIRGESIPMKKDILSGKKKFLALIIAVLINGLNDVFDLDLSVNTLDVATYVAGGFIAVEGALDLVRALSNHFLKKNTIVTVTETPGTATTTISPAEAAYETPRSDTEHSV